MSNVIIVHGEKSGRNGVMTQEFVDRLNKAIEISKNNYFDYIVITGGQTRKNITAEAELGYNYLKDKVSLPIILEQVSKTTSENIRFVKKLLTNKKINKLTIISSQKRIKRIKYLYSRLWPEINIKIDFVAAKDLYPLYYSVIELIYLLYAHLDPSEKTLAFILKKIFRNS